MSYVIYMYSELLDADLFSELVGNLYYLICVYVKKNVFKKELM